MLGNVKYTANVLYNPYLQETLLMNQDILIKLSNGNTYVKYQLKNATWHKVG